MLNPELEKYLRECKSRNMTFDQVENSLSAAGYQAESINQVRIWYGQESTLPSLSPRQAADSHFEQPRKKSVARPILFIIVCLLLFFLLSFTSLYVIATDKIKLPDPELHRRVSMVYYSLPGISKPPKIVIEQAVLAHQKVLKNSFDLSLSISGLSNSIGGVFGNNNLDLSLKGFADYTQVENPKFNLSFLLGKDLNIEARKKDKMLYIQAPRIPASLYLMLGLEPDKFKPLLKNWIGIDTTPLQTEASKKISEIKKKETIQSQTQKTTEEILKKMLDEKILSLLFISSENLEGRPIYKIRFKPTPDQLDMVVDSVTKASAAKPTPTIDTSPKSEYKQPKASEYIKNPEVLVYIGKKDSYVYRVDVSFRLDFDKSISSPVSLLPIPGISNQKNPIDVASVFVLSGFGSDVPISTPDQFLTQEEFYQKWLELQPGGMFGTFSPTRQTSRARNAQRKTDLMQLKTAIENYKVANDGNLPLGITFFPQEISKKGFDLCKIISPYISILPIDPSLNKPGVDNCQSEYDTGYTIMRDADSGSVILRAPLAEEGEVIVVSG